MTYRAIAIFLTLAASGPALSTAPSGPSVTLASNVFVERPGDSSRIVQPAAQLRPGDRVVTVVTWKRSGRGGTFTVTNPLPRAVQFQSSTDDNQEVSIDGGHNWGRLGTLHMGNRIATPQDATHVRWRIATPAPQGRIAYSAIVR